MISITGDLDLQVTAVEPFHNWLRETETGCPEAVVRAYNVLRRRPTVGILIACFLDDITILRARIIKYLLVFRELNSKLVPKDEYIWHAAVSLSVVQQCKLLSVKYLLLPIYSRLCNVFS